MVSMRRIQSVANEIARRFHPQRIILFGSYAYGRPDGDSDVDFLVLMKGRRVHDRALKIRQQIDFDFPVDVLVRSPGEYRRRIAWGDFFLREIHEKGKILYEAPDAGMGQKMPRATSTPRNASCGRVSLQTTTAPAFTASSVSRSI
jgi:predicted nucleotidyltransferase